MSLTKVFDNLNDAIFVVNHHGELTYFNAAASDLICGTTVDTIGIPRVTEMLNLVLNEQIVLPVRFKVSAGFATQEFHTTLTRIYSFYIVSMTASVSWLNQADADQPRKLHYSPITSLREQLDVLSDLLIAAGSLDSDASSRQLDLSRLDDLSDKLADIKVMLSMLLPTSVDQIRPVSLSILMMEVLENLKAKSAIRSLDVEVYDQPQFAIFVSCNSDWLRKALMQCLMYVIGNSTEARTIRVVIGYSELFNTIKITAGDQRVLAENVEMIGKAHFVANPLKRPHPSYISPNLSLALHVLDKFKGNLIINDTEHHEELLLKFPSGEIQFEDADLSIQQCKLYARELAELKSKLDTSRDIQ